MAWNCRGLGRPTTVRCLRDLVRSHRPGVIFLSETKVAQHDQAVKIGNFIGYTKLYCIPSYGSSGGLIVLWKDEVVLNIILGNSYMIHYVVEKDGSTNDNWWQITFIYGPPIPSYRAAFWEEINRVGDTVEGAWLMVGDFNAVLDQKDNKGGKPVASTSAGGFRDMINRNGLLDLGFTGYAFTWNNRRASKANIQERLDRSFANGDWRTLFLNSVVSHLTALHSDHRPILINTSPPTANRPKPFRFEAMWTRDDSTATIIESTWKKGHNHPNLSHLMTKLKYTEIALKD